jgi:hypothetical protein
MGFKAWVKEHSVAVVISVVVILCVIFFISMTTYFGVLSPKNMLPSSSYDKSAYGGSAYGESAYSYNQAIADFAPQVQDRKIETTASLTTLIKRGSFDDADQELHTIIKQANGFIINENVNEYNKAKSGSYNLRIPAQEYDTSIEQLKKIGEVTAFTQNDRDITGAYVNNDIELAAQRERLARLNKLYTERASLDDKLRLERAIFDQERTVKYLEETLTRLDQNVQYSTVDFRLNEKPSSLAGLSFLGFGDLVKTFVISVKGLLYFLFFVLPWAVLIFAIIFIVMKLKER